MPTPDEALVQLLHLREHPVPRFGRRQWDRVVSLAVQEQVCPLVWARVRTSDAGVPSSTCTMLERLAGRSADRAAAAYEQAARTLTSLRSAGVPAALLKGAALARFTYHHDALRPFHDLDVLISEHDRAAAESVLSADGYVTARAPSARLSDGGARVYWDPYRRRLPVDLHWRLDSAPVLFGLDSGRMLARARSVAVDDAAVAVLSPADLVVALAVHFVKHLWWGQPRLRYLRDLAEVVERHAVVWDDVIDTVRTAPLSRSPIRLTLVAASNLLGARVPSGAMSQLAPCRGRFIDRRLSLLMSRRPLCRYAWPLKPFVQVAAMRWLDRDQWEVYPRLAAWVMASRWRRVTDPWAGRAHRR
ncbi:MAG TPA: nucleotidyltransferase family protein [bacterium]|nr:nucleotidyltransferase family protein [bacterium]